MRITCIGLAQIMVGKKYVLWVTDPAQRPDGCLLAPFGSVLNASQYGKYFLEQFFDARNFPSGRGRTRNLSFDVDDKREAEVVTWFRWKKGRELTPRRPVTVQLIRAGGFSDTELSQGGLILQPLKVVPQVGRSDRPENRSQLLIEVHTATLSRARTTRLAELAWQKNAPLHLVSAAEIRQGHVSGDPNATIRRSAAALL